MRYVDGTQPASVASHAEVPIPAYSISCIAEIVCKVVRLYLSIATINSVKEGRGDAHQLTR